MYFSEPINSTHKINEDTSECSDQLETDRPHQSHPQPFNFDLHLDQLPINPLSLKYTEASVSIAVYTDNWVKFQSER